MAALRYRRFLKLCEIWPVDASKVEGNRDLGQHIRTKISKMFSKGEMSLIVEGPECDEIHNSLYRIATNHHRSQYQRAGNINATGYGLKELKLINSSEGLNVLKDSPSVLEKLSMMFKRK